ncbi:RpiB/LacA/LacB family sugar-phosphate isomerase [Candidatus Dojkabacteria bacterium]|uniref:RpiB/LacA/LacB family sugar-phosphate isomerase n=1 Tax=Candidatus Dojkabacteria bacterium TaxID=2099670 RepID=A0A955RKE4_9BACT|nr:RpiB/LacA/LacB family sugar-phosphate isomerase [Candidatus Dojkabacteria bacterium]
MTIYIGADHRGYAKKYELIQFLQSQGYTVVDKGAHELDTDDDYPDFAFSVAEAVMQDNESKGIIICGSSLGVTVAANKVKGIIATNPRSVDEAIEDRKHHGSNVLTLSSDLEDLDTMKEIIQSWMKTPFDGGRHQRRIEKINAYENSH